MATFGHLSDLHFGCDEDVPVRMHRMVQHILATGLDHVVLTGDITHRGREEEYEAFLEVFDPLLRRGMVTMVPGNHDRGGDDVADSIMYGRRVAARSHGDLFLVQLDSTGPHNRHMFRGHGLVTPTDLLALRDALDDARASQLVIVLMHHHPYPLPEEGALERFSAWAGLPYAAELHSGADVLAIARGRADLLLHGHRHVATHRLDLDTSRSLGIYNAGCTPALGRFRVFSHHAGRLTAPPAWQLLPVPPRLPRPTPQTAAWG